METRSSRSKSQKKSNKPVKITTPKKLSIINVDDELEDDEISSNKSKKRKLIKSNLRTIKKKAQSDTLNKNSFKSNK